MILGLLAAVASAGTPYVPAKAEIVVVNVPTVPWPDDDVQPCDGWAWLTPEGTIERLDVPKCDPRLRAALDAASQATFAPLGHAGDDVLLELELSLHHGAAVLQLSVPQLIRDHEQTALPYPRGLKADVVECLVRLDIQGDRVVGVDPGDCPATAGQSLLALTNWHVSRREDDGLPERFVLGLGLAFLQGGPQGRAVVVEDQPPAVRERVESRVGSDALLAHPDDQRCKVAVYIDATGHPTDIEWIDCALDLRDTARDALMKWTWWPTYSDGMPTASRLTMNVTFRVETPPRRARRVMRSRAVAPGGGPAI